LLTPADGVSSARAARAVTWVVVAAYCCFLLSAGCASGPRTGSRAPAFDAVDDSGSPVSFAKYDGKVMVLYFWATWCAPCAISGPELQSLHERYESNPNVVVLGVHYDNRGDAAAYQARHGYTFDIIPDGRGMVSGYGIKKIPYIVIVGADGAIILSQVGFSQGDVRKFEASIETHLSENRRD
jgi:cytochrome c biogenesis protein CcmG/thiol:disulfide interchange protein DsbE